MSANAAVATATMPARSGERAHRIRLVCGYVLAIAVIVGLAVYGFDYYTLGSADRPFSPKHHLLRPSGAIGIKLGFMGLTMFLAIFVYPLRKKWPWLSRQGSSKHWLDIHVLLGLTAPFIIALHSAFKFRGFAGMAFWIMVAVSLSGVIGRYLYAQIPRRLNSAEMSAKELQDVQTGLAEQLKQQRLLPEEDLRLLLRLPSPERVQEMSIVFALGYMMVLDVGRAFRIAKLRRRALALSERFTTLGGFLRTRHASLERAVSTARAEAATAKRILFLSRSQQVFHLWHVVHKPFSYSFALLAIIHIVVVMMMGFF
jgi:Ferric reductase like transmembrane component.